VSSSLDYDQTWMLHDRPTGMITELIIFFRVVKFEPKDGQIPTSPSNPPSTAAAHTKNYLTGLRKNGVETARGLDGSA
jgi:hypothetical protein